MCRSVGNNLGNTLRRQVGSIADWDKVWRWRGWKWCGGVVASPARGIQIGRRGCACIYEIAVPRSFRGSHSGPEIRRRGWGTGLGLGEGGKGIGSMDEAEAGIGMGCMIEGVESSWGVYGRERAGSGGKRGRDLDLDREGGVSSSGESYGRS